jgi:predicted Na+-dependent transporter
MITTCFLKCYEKKQVYSEFRKIEIIKAVSMETGMQNSTLAIAMITLSFPIGTCAEKTRMWNLQVIPLLYSVFLIINSMVIVSVYRFGWKAKKL